jgi:hypothetical protein
MFVTVSISFCASFMTVGISIYASFMTVNRAFNGAFMAVDRASNRASFMIIKRASNRAFLIIDRASNGASTALADGLSAVILLVDTKTSFSSLLDNVVSFVDIVSTIAGVGFVSSVSSGTLLVGVADWKLSFIGILGRSDGDSVLVYVCEGSAFSLSFVSTRSRNDLVV